MYEQFYTLERTTVTSTQRTYNCMSRILRLSALLCDVNVAQWIYCAVMETLKSHLHLILAVESESDAVLRDGDGAKLLFFGVRGFGAEC